MISTFLIMLSLLGRCLVTYFNNFLHELYEGFIEFWGVENEKTK